MGKREEIVAELLAAQDYDGTAEIECGGRVWTLAEERDDVPPMEHINGADVWGRVEWIDERADQPTRPRGFNGAARKLRPSGWAMQGEVWWQPHEDSTDVDADAREVTRLLADGFIGVTVECDGRVASLWGIDGQDGYRAEVVGGLVDEILSEILPIEERARVYLLADVA